MIRILLISILMLSSSYTQAQRLFLISKKQNARSTDYVYEEGEKLVIGIDGQKRIGVFYIENDSQLYFNDSLIDLAEVEWVMVKRGWAERVAQMGIKWGATYFFTFTVNDWYRTGDPFATQYTARNSGTLVLIGGIALAVSLKKCRPLKYHYFLIE